MTPPSGRRGPTTAQLRADIDSGRTGDKVGGLDPAAVPLGVDEEAAGTPVPPEAVAQARALERRPDASGANAAEPDLAPDGRLPNAGRKTLTGMAVVAAVLTLLVFAALVLAARSGAFA